MDIGNIITPIDIGQLPMSWYEKYSYCLDERLCWPSIHFYDNEFPTVLNWCIENFDYQTWYRKYSTWYFKNENDAFLFRLRWL
jgi:hypothetical protein